MPTHNMTELATSQQTFAESKHLTIYIDGSLKDMSTRNLSMGIEWIAFDDSTFKARVQH